MNKNSLSIHRSRGGYTLTEVIVTTLVLGILTAIVAPGFFNILARQRVRVANDQALQSIRDTQNKAQRQKRDWQVSFRNVELDEGSGKLVAQVAVHETDDLDEVPDDVAWETFNDQVKIDDTETTFPEGDENEWYFPFNSDGVAATGSLGRVTFTLNQGPTVKRCVIMSTLLGATRSESDADC